MPSTLGSDTLAAQQLALCRAITAPDAAVGADDADKAGVPTPRLLRTAPGREPLLRIYRHAVPARLTAALRDNFGVLPQVMGDAAFDALALAYQRDQPSRRPSIRWFGDGLADFMQRRTDLAPHPALADLARMEWALRSAFDAADGEPMTAAELQAVAPEDWPQLAFAALPGVQLLPLQWAVEPLWRALRSAPRDGAESGFRAEADAEAEAASAPAPEPLPHHLLVWRQGQETRWRSLGAADAALLRAALAGHDFAHLCELAGELAAAQPGAPPAAAMAVGALQRWLADGLLALASFDTSGRSEMPLRERGRVG